LSLSLLIKNCSLFLYSRKYTITRKLLAPKKKLQRRPKTGVHMRHKRHKTNFTAQPKQKKLRNLKIVEKHSNMIPFKSENLFSPQIKEVKKRKGKSRMNLTTTHIPKNNCFNFDFVVKATPIVKRDRKLKPKNICTPESKIQDSFLDQSHCPRYHIRNQSLPRGYINDLPTHKTASTKNINESRKQEISVVSPQPSLSPSIFNSRRRKTVYRSISNSNKSVILSHKSIPNQEEVDTREAKGVPEHRWEVDDNSSRDSNGCIDLAGNLQYSAHHTIMHALPKRIQESAKLIDSSTSKEASHSTLEGASSNRVSHRCPNSKNARRNRTITNNKTWVNEDGESSSKVRDPKASNCLEDSHNFGRIPPNFYT